MLDPGDGHMALMLVLEERPSIAVLDIEIATLKGLEVCAALKSESRWAICPASAASLRNSRSVACGL